MSEAAIERAVPPTIPMPRGARREMGVVAATEQDGARRVLALLAATRAALVPFAGDEETAAAADEVAGAVGAGDARGTALDPRRREVASAAREAAAGLARVAAWLAATLPGAAAPATLAPARAEPPAPGRAPRPEPVAAERLVAGLRAAIDELEALGAALERDDPLTHFDAVQAAGLAAAVLEAAHLRLLRAGLARPRPVNLLAP